MQEASFRVAGDRALIMSFGEEVSEDINRKVQLVYRAIRRESIPGLVEAIPTYCQLCLYYEPLITGPDELRRRVEALSMSLGPAMEQAAPVGVPICFDGECELDLGAVAALS